MSNLDTLIDDLVKYMHQRGWSCVRSGGRLSFQKGKSEIHASASKVRLEHGDASRADYTSMMWPTDYTLRWIADQIRHYAGLVEVGQADQMERWERVQRAIQTMSWDTALNAPHVLDDIEKALEQIQPMALKGADAP